jgi:hypothetical protein
MVELFISPTIALGLDSFSLKILSITDISALVVSIPQKAHQSLTLSPALITSLPLFTDPACCSKPYKDEFQPYNQLINRNTTQ